MICRLGCPDNTSLEAFSVVVGVISSPLNVAGGGLSSPLDVVGGGLTSLLASFSLFPCLDLLIKKDSFCCFLLDIFE